MEPGLIKDGNNYKARVLKNILREFLNWPSKMTRFLKAVPVPLFSASIEFFFIFAFIFYISKNTFSLIAPSSVTGWFGEGIFLL